MKKLNLHIVWGESVLFLVSRMHLRDLSTCVSFQKQMFVCIHSSMRVCMCMYVRVQPYAYIFIDAMNKEH